LTGRVFVTWIAPLDRDAVLLKKAQDIGQSAQQPTALIYTYGLSDNKVATSIVDIVIIIDKIALRDVPFFSQTIARLARGGGVERAHGGPLFQAQSTG
jgi:hypothetical protein